MKSMAARPLSPCPLPLAKDIHAVGEVPIKGAGNTCETGTIWQIGVLTAERSIFGAQKTLSGSLNRLNAVLSLLQPRDCYRIPSAIGSAIGRPLSRPISHPNTGGSPQPPRSKPLGGLNCAIVIL